MLSVMNKSRIAIKTKENNPAAQSRGFVLFREPCPTESRPANWISLVLSVWPFLRGSGGRYVLNGSFERQVANHLKSVLWFYMHLQGLNFLTVLG
jgi:hypothetical protein